MLYDPGEPTGAGHRRRPSGRALLGSVNGVSVSSWTRTITSRDARRLFSSNIRLVIMVAMTAGLELLGVYVPHFRGVDIGTPSTLSRKQPNVLFGSLMPFALDPAGRPTFLIAIWSCKQIWSCRPRT
jgi:hypothetical protein